jgi:hypothetical protein
MKKPETKFKEKVQKDLKSLDNFYMLKTQERARRGVPDIIFCANGGFGALELKREEEELEPLQEVKIQEIRQAKGFALMVKPSTWPTTFQLIKRVFYK